MDEPQQVISEPRQVIGAPQQAIGAPQQVTEPDIVSTSLQRLDERGMTTAEYAVGTLAAVAFAVVLMAVVRSDTVHGALAAVIQAALAMGQ